MGCFRRKRGMNRPIITHRSPSPNCRCSCHRLERRVVSACEPSPYVNNEAGSSLKTKKSADLLRRAKSLDRYPSFAMDITYVTERIIVVLFPNSEPEPTYRSNVKDMTRMLRTKHGTKYTIFNLSEKRQDLAKLNPQVQEFGWPPYLAPSLERLCSICKSIDSWLSKNSQNIAVIHSKDDRGRAGVVTAAYMHYTNICASAHQSLDRFAMKQFFDDKLYPYIQPSQNRYINYFSGLLSGSIHMNNKPLYLQRLIIYGVPNFDSKGGSELFVKVYQNMQLIYSSGVYSASDKSRKVVMGFDSGLQVRGDIFIKCYHKSHQPVGRYPVFRTQFHTCTVDSDHLTFEKRDLDDAAVDSRFPDNGKVEFWFSYRKDEYLGRGSTQDTSSYIRSSNDPLVKWDSYENFDSGFHDRDLDFLDADLIQEGPLDGSPYAVIRKDRKFTEMLIQPPSSHEPFIDLDGPHSVDSGISSNSGAKTTELESRSPSDMTGKHTMNSYGSGTRHDQLELDELVNGMLQEIQSIPDTPSYHTLKPSYTSYETHTPYSRTLKSKTTYEVHQPRDYGSPKSLNTTSGVFVNGTKQYLTSDLRDEDFIIPQRTTYTYNTVSRVDRPRSYSDMCSPLEILQQRHPKFNEPRFHSEAAQSWLHRQQEKLKARKEGRCWEDRHIKEQQMLAELRSTQYRKAGTNEGESTDDVSLGFDFSSSSRETSPTKVSSYTLPLHVNTSNGHAPSGTLKPPVYKNTSAPSSPILPHRTSSKDVTRNRYPQFQTQSKTIVRQKSDTSFDRERPFMLVKKAHQQAKDIIASNQTSPQNVIAYSSAYTTQYNPSDKRDAYNQGLLGLLDTPDHRKIDTGNTKLDKLEHSLQELSYTSNSLNQSPQDVQNSPFYFGQSTPKQVKHSSDGPTWSPSVINTSPPSSPSRSDRPITPSFPVSPGTPYQNQEICGSSLPPKSPGTIRKERSPSPATIQKLQQDLPISAVPHSSNGQSSPTVYYGQSRPPSLVSLNESSEVIHHHPLFVKDTSKFWYKPDISREEAISILKDKLPGTFIVRDSSSFPGAYGLALKVASLPPNVLNKTGDLSNELVRHFLIEPTQKGVRLKGCPNEPVFGSLSALVYQHSITALALPCKLLLPDQDPAGDFDVNKTAKNDALLEQGAACNVIYLNTVDMESLTGPQAIKKALTQTLAAKSLSAATPVHFKVSSQGITLNDNTHKLFFRRHYPVKSVSHCGLDPESRRWTQVNEEGVPVSSSCIFGFVARKPASQTDNQCHLFAELDPEQPASAIVNFVTKVMMPATSQNRSDVV